MFITRVDQKIQTSDTKGRTKITFEIEFDNCSFIQDAKEDLLIKQLVDQFLMVAAAFITNLLHFYKKSPTLATYVLGSTLKELSEKNNYYRTIIKQLPSETKMDP